jgi:hypothetical protein
MNQPEHVQRLRDIAQRHDLDGLHAEISAALDGVPEQKQPYVATTLLTALDRFTDSYLRQPALDE